MHGLAANARSLDLNCRVISVKPTKNLNFTCMKGVITLKMSHILHASINPNVVFFDVIFMLSTSD